MLITRMADLSPQHGSQLRSSVHAQFKGCLFYPFYDFLPVKVDLLKHLDEFHLSVVAVSPTDVWETQEINSPTS